MSTPAESALMSLTFHDSQHLKNHHAEGSVIHSIPAAAYVVLDEFISTVCSCCLKLRKVKRCSKCVFVGYCSTYCQALDWKERHKDECRILKAVWEACPNQPTSFARLFVRNGLRVNDNLTMSGLRAPPGLFPDCFVNSRMEARLRMFHEPQNCRTLFRSWTPILEALDRHRNTNQRQFPCFMNSLADLMAISIPMHPENSHALWFGYDGSKNPIAYCTYVNKTSRPFFYRNVVLVTVMNPNNGPTLRLVAPKAVRAGEMLYCAEAENLLVSPITLAASRLCPFDEESLHMAGQAYIVDRAELVCYACKTLLKIRKTTHGSLRSLESLRYLEVCCLECETDERNYEICDLLITRVARLTAKAPLQSQLSENQLIFKVDEIKSLISILGSVVASTSFALGILYREIALVYEKLGRMDKCVEAYKKVLPIAEKHLDKYDQNIYDGLARVIVFHLERNEVADSLPYIKMAWERLRYIPGRDSYDFYVVDKLRTAVQEDNFSFEVFCSVEPNP